jgi:hypothetical protein
MVKQSPNDSCDITPLMSGIQVTLRYFSKLSTEANWNQKLVILDELAQL